jgi:hypothetical protein
MDNPLGLVYPGSACDQEQVGSLEVRVRSEATQRMPPAVTDQRIQVHLFAHSVIALTVPCWCSLDTKMRSFHSGDPNKCPSPKSMPSRSSMRSLATRCKKTKKNAGNGWCLCISCWLPACTHSHNRHEHTERLLRLLPASTVQGQCSSLTVTRSFGRI